MAATIFYRLTLVIALSIVSLSANAEIITPTSWTTYNQGNATSSFDVNGNISLFAQGVSYSAAVAELGNLSGFIDISFDYTTYVNGWPDGPYVGVLTSNAGSFSIPNNLGNHTLPTLYAQAYGSTSQTISAHVLVDGSTQLIFGVAPNEWSFMGDHMGTSFNITNLIVSSVPETGTSIMLLMGLGLFGFIVRKQKS